MPRPSGLSPFDSPTGALAPFPHGILPASPPTVAFSSSTQTRVTGSVCWTSPSSLRSNLRQPPEAPRPTRPIDPSPHRATRDDADRATDGRAASRAGPSRAGRNTAGAFAVREHADQPCRSSEGSRRAHHRDSLTKPATPHGRLTPNSPEKSLEGMRRKCFNLP